MTTFTLHPAGPFSLGAASRFVEGFGPAMAGGAPEPGHLHLAFVVEGSDIPAGVCLREDGEGGLVGESSSGADVVAVRRQAARILSVDVDATGWPAVGVRDRAVGGLQRANPGLRPVCFGSAFEAAAWAVISARSRMAQAARVKARLTEELGAAVDIHGDVRRAFPAPWRIARLRDFPGIGGRKPGYLRAVAEAALDGLLDPDRLRALPTEDALDELRTIGGIGDFSAELILLRGAGHPDVLPIHERRLRPAVAAAYDLDEPPTVRELEAIADPWRPFRGWAAFLLRVAFDREG